MAAFVAAPASVVAAACSLITHLEPPSDALCTPEIVTDVGDAGLTSVVVDSVTNSAYFSGTLSSSVYAVALDAPVGSKANVVMTLDGARRLAIANGNTGKDQLDTYVFATAQGVSGAGGLFVLPPDAGQSAIVTGANVHADGLFVRGAYPPAIWWLASDPGGGEQIRSSAVDGATTVVADIDASLHDIVATDALTLWTTTKLGASAIRVSDAGTQTFTCGGVIAYVPNGNLVPARIYMTSETPCVNGKNQISFIPADDPTATPTTFLTDDRLSGPTSMVYDGTKYLYIANNTNATIVRASVDGTSGLEAVATSPAPPHQITYANGVLYWTTDTSLVRCVLR